jgi:hypothetical protein
MFNVVPVNRGYCGESVVLKGLQAINVEMLGGKV